MPVLPTCTHTTYIFKYFHFGVTYNSKCPESRWCHLTDLLGENHPCPWTEGESGTLQPSTVYHYKESVVVHGTWKRESSCLPNPQSEQSQQESFMLLLANWDCDDVLICNITSVTALYVMIQCILVSCEIFYYLFLAFVPPSWLLWTQEIQYVYFYWVRWDSQYHLYITSIWR